MATSCRRWPFAGKIPARSLGVFPQPRARKSSSCHHAGERRRIARPFPTLHPANAVQVRNANALRKGETSRCVPETVPGRTPGGAGVQPRRNAHGPGAVDREKALRARRSSEPAARSGVTRPTTEAGPQATQFPASRAGNSQPALEVPPENVPNRPVPTPRASWRNGPALYANACSISAIKSAVSSMPTE